MAFGARSCSDERPPSPSLRASVVSDRSSPSLRASVVSDRLLRASEPQIPFGVNRCWVKTVEKGTFPDTRRFFFPVLCNQCDEAPCARICPTNALFKRRDGIVDLHSDACIGCRACMVACPYDQLFIDPNTHTAEKF